MVNEESNFKKTCEELGGELKNSELCVVEGYPMGDSKHVLGFKKYSQAYETWNPDRFLEMTGWRGDWPWSPIKPFHDEEKVEELKEKIEKDEPLDVPFIDKDVDRGFEPREEGGRTWVPNHEGRHRAMACKLSDKCDKIPVVVYHKKKGYYVDKDGNK